MQTLLTAPQNACRDIPAAWVDRLFERLATLYGRQWIDLWADVPLADVKDAWQSALAGCSGEQIRRALEHLSTHNKFAPTAPEFAVIARQFRDEPAHVPALPRPHTEMPEGVRDELRRFVREHSIGEAA